MSLIIESEFRIEIGKKDLKLYEIRQADNMLFRQVRRIANCDDECGKYVVFVDCAGGLTKESAMTRLIKEGFYINDNKFVLSERSASMTRNSILSFVRESISDSLNEAVTMGALNKKSVLSKLMAYRGLMLSSCHCLDGFRPKIIVVPDYETVVKDQEIKYIYDKVSEFTNEDGDIVEWKQKDIATGRRDIKVEPFDGFGIHHPSITDEVQFRLGAKDDDTPTTILWRAPYIKGLSCEVDYESFFAERGVTTITDIWGAEHDVTPGAEPMLILSKSMYKGFAYYKNTGGISDWEYYWEQFEKYNHCIGVAKWNFTQDTEPVYTRCNYQVLQTLDMPYNDFAELATKSVEWAQRIIDGDILYSLCFLGLTADRMNPLNYYTKAILKNTEMLKQREVRNYMINLLKKYMEDMRCGKIWIRSCFKFLVPDIIAFMEAAAGLPVNGCLSGNEFYCVTKCGPLIGDKLVTRNPHICSAENLVLNAVNNDMTERYFSHLANTCIINSNSIIPQRLNGADFDGDLVLVFDDKRLLDGVNREAIPVIDVDDKVTTEPEEFTLDNKLKVTLRTMKNMIGEYSNYATAYHNRVASTHEQREKYDKYIDIISVLTGKSIDYAKTGVLYPMPRNIAKYGRTLPYFMKYASPYYARMKLSYSKSNMNKLCWEIERWSKKIRFKRVKGFDYKIMIDDSIDTPQEYIDAVDVLYKEFCRETTELNKRRKYFSDDDVKRMYADVYNKYADECLSVCSGDIKMLANIAVLLCNENKSRNQKFQWIVAGAGIVQNIKQCDICLPEKTPDGDDKYLGNRYSMVKVCKEDVIF